MTLKRLLLILALSPVIFVGVLFSSYFSYQWLNILKEDDKLRTQELLEQMVLANEYNLAIQNITALTKTGEQLIRNPKFLSVTFLNENGNILVVVKRSNNLKDNWAKNHWLINTFINVETLVRKVKVDIFSSSIESEDEFTQTSQESKRYLLGSLQVKHSLLPLVTEQLHFFTNYAYLILLTAILLYIFIRKIVTKIITNQIDHIQHTIKKVSKGDFNNLSKKYSLSEFSRINSGIEKMAKTIQENQKFLQKNIKEATQELQETLTELESKNALLDITRKKAIIQNQYKSRFIAQMSHEIRTPMNSIIGFTELLMRDDISHNSLEKVRTIQDSSLNLLNLINNILDLSKIESGGIRVSRNKADLRLVFEEVYRSLSSIAEHKKLNFCMEGLNQVTHYVETDVLKIKQILINLGSNAVKFTNQGYVKIKLSTELTPQNKLQISVDIIDSGIGISKSNQKNLFKEYGQANDEIQGKFGGSGLGLHLSKILSETLHGTISLIKSNKQGSHFNIRLLLKVLNPIKEKKPTKLITNIVYVDCEKAKQALKENIFKEAGYQLFKPDNVPSIEPYIIIIELYPHIKITEQINYVKSLKLDKNAKKYLYCTPYLQSNQHLKELTFNSLFSKTPLSDKLIDEVNLAFKGYKQSKPKSKQILWCERIVKILAVDDQKTNLKVIEGFCNINNYALDTANSGQKAIELVLNNTYDIILMDIQMPQMDGIETSKAIHNLNIENTPPIIAITADGFEETKNKAFASGISNVLIKPFTFNQLDKLILECLSISNKENKNKSIYDERLALEQAGGKSDLAKGLLDIFLNSLPEQKSGLIKAITKRNLKEINFYAHKIHSGVCFCGMPKLKNISKQTEKLSYKQDHLAIKEAEQLVAVINETMDNYNNI